MRKALLPGLLAALASLFFAPFALAKVEVQIVKHQTSGTILAAKITEDIAPGDYEVLLKGIIANPGKHVRKVLILDNIGGSVQEAIRMGRLLRETGFDSLVPAGAVCQGACVYLLAAGRAKTVRGHVGVHRPYYPEGDSAQARVISKGSTHSSLAYFREMNIPSSLVETMQATAPSNMRVLSAQELSRYRLN
jgi:hypothetical protein